MKPHQDDRESAELPPELLAALRELHRPGLVVPPGFDERVLSDARQQWARQRRRRLIIRLVPATAAAAAIALVVWLAGPWGRQSGPGGGPHVSPDLLSQTLPQDVNGDGRVDILDAYTLARRVEAADVAGLKWDFNDDQVVDRRDADAVALAAVRLDREAVQ